MEISLALASASKSLEILKAMRDIDKSYDAATYKAKIAELMGSVADSKIALIEARDKISSLDKEIEVLKKSFQLKGSSVVYEGYSFPSDADGNPIGRPYCPRCEQIDGRIILLVPDKGPLGTMICAQCKSAYKDVPALPFT